MLSTRNINYEIGNRKILQNVTAAFQAGEFNVILGPNGSGKSTFLKIFSGELQPTAGDIYYNQQNIQTPRKEDLAKFRAVMTQQAELNFPLPVEEVVMMGRYPHFTYRPAHKDLQICKEAMRKLQVHALVGRNYLTLSGGEKQRVQFARVLAQIWESPPNGCRYLFLDEPLNNLDINYQQAFLGIAKQLVLQQTVLIAVLHDINLAVQYADKLLFLKEGKTMAFGKPKEVLSEEMIWEVFSVETKIIVNPLSGQPLMVYKN